MNGSFCRRASLPKNLSVNEGTQWRGGVGMCESWVGGIAHRKIEPWKKTPGGLGFIGDETLPKYIGISS